MKTIFNTAKKVLLGLLPLGLLVMTPFLASCGDDNDDSGAAQMVINKVYLENASAEDSVYDREVSFARLGQLIRLEGSGFTGLKHVYVNGYDTYFNNALMTDNNVWITLNANTPVAKAEASVRNTIQLVKDNATYTYQFTIRASSPSVTSVDNTLPRPGEKVTVYGNNLQETTHLTLPGGVEITEGITSDEDGKWYSFTMPSGVTESGSITSEGANGTAVTRLILITTSVTSSTSMVREHWAAGAQHTSRKTLSTIRWLLVVVKLCSLCHRVFLMVTTVE